MTPDRAAYESGRAEGVAAYCTPAGGYAAGRAGRAYEGVCAADTPDEFFAAYRHGRAYYALRRRIAALERAEDFRCYGFLLNCRDRFYLRGRGGYHTDLYARAELSRLRREIWYFSQWPPPGEGTATPIATEAY